MENCEHNCQHLDMEFDECIHMHHTHSVVCDTNCNCDIPMTAATESFVSAGSSVWTLVKKIGVLINDAKIAILEKVSDISELIDEAKETIVGMFEGLAKQGDDETATNTAIKNELDLVDGKLGSFDTDETVSTKLTKVSSLIGDISTSQSGFTDIADISESLYLSVGDSSDTKDDSSLHGNVKKVIDKLETLDGKIDTLNNVSISYDETNEAIIINTNSEGNE